jgi:hypothetical protein
MKWLSARSRRISFSRLSMGLLRCGSWLLAALSLVELHPVRRSIPADMHMNKQYDILLLIVQNISNLGLNNK